MPVTIEHPSEGVVNSGIHKIVSVGTVMFPARVEQEYFLRMRFQIFDGDIVNEIMSKIQRGEHWDVSCGYSADLEERPGNFNGTEYDAIHKNIRYNHLSLVSKGRAGNEVGIISGDDDKECYKWGLV